MAARQFYYAESTGESTDLDTTGAYADKVTLTFTPDASSTYYLIASWFMQQLTSTVRYVGGLFSESGTPTTYQEILHDTHDTTEDYYAGGGLGIFTEGASPASRSFKIQVKGENNAVSEKIKNARIIAIKKDSADQHVEQTTRQTRTANTYADISGASLTFSPASQGDYIIIAMAQYDMSAATDMGILMDIDGSTYGEVVGRVQDTALNKYPYYFVKRVNLTAASHTIKMRFKSDGSATLGVDKIRIIALRADTFDNNYYDEETTRATTTSTSYTDTSVSITQTPQAVDHLILASGVIDSSSATQDMYMRLLEGATEMGALAIEPKANTNKYPFFAMYSKELAASPTTWKLQYKAETSNTVGYDEAAISIIQLEVGSTTTTQTQTGVSRITATTTRTQTGKAKVQNTTTQTQTGKSRIQKSVTQPQTGVSRIVKSVPQTITGVARIQATTTRTQTGKAAIQKTTTQTITGKANITTATTRTQTGKADILTGTSEAVIDSYSESNASSGNNLYSTNYTKVGQSFTSPSGHTHLARAKFYIRKVGSPTGDIVARLYAHSGTLGSSSVATGAALASSDPIDVSTLSASNALVEFIFSAGNQYLFAASTNYVIALEYSGGDASNNVFWSFDGSSPTHAGNQARFFGGSWSADAGQDLIFYVYQFADGTTTTQTIQGKSRITAVTTRTQTGVSRITATTTRTQTGISRITASTTKTQTWS